MTVKSTVLFALAACLFAAFSSPSHAEPALVESYGSIPLAFTANDGRTAPEVAFTTNGAGCGMFFTPTGTTYVLDGGSSDAAAKPGVNGESTTRESFALACRFIGANPSPEITGEDRLSWNSNYFIGGDPAKWRTDVPNYGKIRLHDLYDGVDLVYYGSRSRLKYDFIIDPGEVPSTIRLQYDFGDAGGTLNINEDGDLVVSTPAGDLIERAPYAYQMIEGGEIEVEAHYRIIDADAGEYGFTVGGYDPAHELVIDPELVYSTYLGGNSQSEYSPDIAVDQYENVYITGETLSLDFPTTSGAFDETFSGDRDCFVTKIHSDGSTILYSTYIGGTSVDSGIVIKVDIDDFAYILIRSDSPDFPTESSVPVNTLSTPHYIVKLDKDGSNVMHSKYIGGSYGALINDMKMDKNHNLYLTGFTRSVDFPVTPEAYKTDFSEDRNCFVTKMNEDLEILYSTFLGNGNARKIAVDDEGNSYITGTTYSPDFPISDGAYDTMFESGKENNFILKMNYNLSGLLYSTFFGTRENNRILDLAADNSGYAYLVGSTGLENFPTTDGAYDITYNGGSADGFVVRLNANAGGLDYSTYLGGSDYDEMDAIIMDAQRIIVLGYTNSGDFPASIESFTYDEYFPHDFITVLNVAGEMIDSVFIPRYTNNIMIDDSGDVYLSGEASSPQNGNVDILITKLRFATTTSVSSDESDYINRPAPPVEIRNYPNPFNASTTIAYTLRIATHVRVSIFSISGQKIAELIDEYQAAGTHEVLWNAPDVASGLYIARIEANGHVRHADMMLLK